MINFTPSHSYLNKKGIFFIPDTGAKAALGPNCMIPYGIIQIGPKVSLAPMILDIEQKTVDVLTR